MNKVLSGMLRASALLMVLVLLVISPGCLREKGKDEGGVKVLCTFLPVWILTKNVVMDIDGVEVALLLPSDISPHYFEMTPGDMKRIARADILVKNGHGLELFLGDTVRRANSDIRIVTASRGIEPIYFGNEEARDVGEHKDRRHQHGAMNPHTWVSPKQAIRMVENIRDGLSVSDPENADAYKENAEAYVSRLERVVNDYREVLDGFESKRIVTGHHSFEYLARDFDIEIVAVILETEEQGLSPGDLKKVIKETKESDAAAIFTEPGFPARTARIIGEQTGKPVLTLDPLGTGRMDSEEYIRVMRKNLEELERAFVQTP